jgi:hypothetical protein
MAEVLVLAVHSNGKVKKVTGELLTAARRLGEPAWCGRARAPARAGSASPSSAPPASTWPTAANSTTSSWRRRPSSSPLCWRPRLRRPC